MSTPMPYNTSLHQVTVGPVPGGLQEVIYSGKHNGIYIYLARILRWVGHHCPSPYSSAQWDLHLPGSHPQVSWPPLSLSLLFSTVGSTSAWLASSGDLGTPLPLPTLQHNRIYVYLARILRWVGHPSPSPCCSSHVVTQLLKCQCWSKWNVWLRDHRGVRTLWTWLLGTFLQTLPESVMPLKGHSLSLRNCPLMLSAPSERYEY